MIDCPAAADLTTRWWEGFAETLAESPEPIHWDQAEHSGLREELSPDDDPSHLRYFAATGIEGMTHRTVHVIVHIWSAST